MHWYRQLWDLGHGKRPARCPNLVGMKQCEQSRATAGAKYVLSAILALAALIALTFGQPVHHGPFGKAHVKVAATSASVHDATTHLSQTNTIATQQAVAGEGSSSIGHGAAVHHTPTQHLSFILSDDCATCANELVTSLMACVIALLLVMFAFAGPRFFRILTRTPRNKTTSAHEWTHASHRTVDLIALGISRT